ncbi:mannitol dehydrogenase family protein [Pseudolysinimonas kribbensis]|uniref:mannitol dehydrogenase family protein n=1 Tax=Pseudolysinimonas kribbensis TaxID=433641 RepID=UPI0031E45C56
MTPVAGIDYDRSAVSVGIVHFGVGNFHRSHQAMYLDRLLRDPATFEAARTWGICGIGVLPGDRAMRDALGGQDFEYTLVERHPDGTAPATRIGSLVDYLYAPDQLEEVLELLAAPTTRIVSLTITEGGYNISDVTGEFDVANPAIVADARPGAAPATVFGIIVAGLARRRERGIPPFTLMSCDNIEGNGDVARRTFAAFARLVDPELAAWIERGVRFPNCMVDRITPVTSDADRAWVAETFGVQDAWPVLCEDFVQWVLEDEFGDPEAGGGRPPWERAGVQLVEDVRPYELMKLRLLNASHQALAYAGILAGYEFAHDATRDPVIARYLRAYMDREGTPTLEPVPGVDLDAYKSKLIERFSNEYVRDTLGRLATDASDRIPKWLVPVIRELRASGRRAPLSASIVAGWARYAERVVAGEALPFRDRQEDAVRDAVARMAGDPLGFLRNPDWFGGLPDDDGFVADFTASLAAFRGSDDPRPELERLLAGPAA